MNYVSNATKDKDQLTVCTVIGVSYTLDKAEESYQNNETNTTIVESLGSNESSESVLSIKSTDNTEYDVSSDESKQSDIKKEKWWSITIQVAIPFIIAGFGTIGAGVVLGNVQHYPVFKSIGNLIILIPPILGLKGNLDMCLASRLSTQANLGNMSSAREIFKMIVGNIALVQVQAIVAAILVSIFAVATGTAMSGNQENASKVFQDSILLVTSSILTATISCFILDLVMVAVIFASHKIHMNPDNLATPLAASIGDIVSLSLLSAIASQIFNMIDDYYWILFVILGVYIFILLPIWVFVVKRNKYTKAVLTTGWVPVISALVISGMGGLVLNTAVDQYEGFVVFQPIINGIGGNLVSVQSSRISTMLHQSSLFGILPPHTKQWVSPWTALITGVYSAKTARILILMAIPGQTIFVFIADYFYSWTSTVGPIFVVVYVMVGLIQVMTLLYISHILIHTMWRYKIDPDNSAIPYLTSLGDLIGSSLLLLAFMFLKSIGEDYSSVQGT